MVYHFCTLKLYGDINPISAGVLENQDMLGGGQFDPPSKSHVLCPSMTNDTSFGMLLCSTFRICKKKLANLQKLNFLAQNIVPSYQIVSYQIVSYHIVKLPNY